MDIQITQDIRKYKTKDLGNFNFKEVGVMILAAAAGFAAYKFGHLALEESVMCAIPILVVGFLKPFGLSFFQFARTVLREELFSPRTYINETDFVYDPDGFDELYGEHINISSEWSEPDVSPEYKQPKENLKVLIR